MAMEHEFERTLKYLRLWNLLARWDELLAEARRGRFSHERLLTHVLRQECQAKNENGRLLRRKRAHIPELLEIETFPFSRQRKLNRKRIMSYYDKFDYMTKQQNIIWLGPTGCGKTGLATGFLLQANRFFFFSLEESRMYVHVRSPAGEAKYWLEPDV